MGGLEKKRSLLLQLVEDLGRLSIWPAAMFYLVPTHCFIYFLKHIASILEPDFFFLNPDFQLLSKV